MPKLKPARKVIVVDDNETSCVFLATMLNNWGYKVEICIEAQYIDLDDLTVADIIFLDVMKPRMDRLPILNVLASRQITSSIVLMNSVGENVLTAGESLTKGSDLQLIGVLYKPFRYRDVLAILEEF